MYKILIVEDDLNIARGMGTFLSRYGLEPIIVEKFDHIDEEVQKEEPHLVLLDINLPFYNGFYWCKKIRKNSICPIIIVSSKDGSMDQVMALENGADDYICKPFDDEIFIAKVRSHLRRNYGDYKKEISGDIYEKEGIVLDKRNLTMSYLQNKVFLSHKEMVLIEALLECYPQNAKRELLLEKVWDDQSFIEINTLNVNINRIRKKLEEIGLVEVLETIRGFGYRLNLKK